MGPSDRCIQMVRVRLTISITHSTRQWRPPPIQTENFARRFVMNSMTLDVFPAQKFPDPTAASGLGLATSMMTQAASWEKPKAQQTARSSTKSFTATIHQE